MKKIINLVCDACDMASALCDVAGDLLTDLAADLRRL